MASIEYSVTKFYILAHFLGHIVTRSSFSEFEYMGLTLLLLPISPPERNDICSLGFIA